MWILNLPSLKELSILVCCGEGFEQVFDASTEYVFCADEDSDAKLGLESLCLSGIGAGDWGLLGRSCRKLKKLKGLAMEGLFRPLLCFNEVLIFLS
ncbi:hypothetical protein ACE6H2_008589 [Prunus campanulata]